MKISKIFKGLLSLLVCLFFMVSNLSIAHAGGGKNYTKFYESSDMKFAAAKKHIKNMLSAIEINHDAQSDGQKTTSEELVRPIPVETGRIFFGGNQFWVVGVDNYGSDDLNDNDTQPAVYLYASKPYLYYPFNLTNFELDSTENLNAYENSLIRQYLKGTGNESRILQNGEITTVLPNTGYGTISELSVELTQGQALRKYNGTDATTLYNDFFAPEREVDYNAILDTTVKTADISVSKLAVPAGAFSETANIENFIDNMNDTKENKPIAEIFDSPNNVEVLTKNFGLANTDTLSTGKFWLPSANRDFNDPGYFISLGSLDTVRNENYNEMDPLRVPNSYWSCKKTDSNEYSSLYGEGCWLRSYDLFGNNTPSAALQEESSKSSVLTSNCDNGYAWPEYVTTALGVAPALRLGLNSVVFVEPEEKNMILFEKNKGKVFKAGSDYDYKNATNKNLVLTLNDKERKSIQSSVLISKPIKFNGNGILSFEIAGNLAENEYVAIILDDGKKTAFVVPAKNEENSDASAYSYENSQSGINYSVLTDFKEGSDVKILICKDNLIGNYCKEDDTADTEHCADACLSTENYKIRYASEIDESGFDEWDNGVRVRAEKNVFPQESSLKVEVLNDNSESFEIVKQNIDNPQEVEHFTSYKIAVIDPEGEKIENFNSAEVWLPIEGYMDEEDLEARFVTESKDEVKNGSIKSFGDKKYYVFETNHFSHYVLIDKLSEKEKPFQNPKTSSCNNTGKFLMIGTSSFIACAVWIIIKKREYLSESFYY
ncbi:MAG: hypothetical protein LBK29_02705 [Oscillospiraceae bacterium]|jgi:hypothetical protein|nr:hypothetical protein [Oscillospiraceae bacterium]